MVTAIRKKTSASIVNSKNFQNFLQNQTKFDVIIIETLYCEELLALGYHFNAPIISISPTMESNEMYMHTAVPSLKSSTPSTYSIYSNKMTFWQRTRNLLAYSIISFLTLLFKWSSSLTPNIIEVGGLAIQPDEVQALPSDLQTFLDEAKSGAIYFSLGSIVDDSKIAIETNLIFLNVMAELPNVKFLVKSNELEKLSQNIPKNILIRSWLPQKAILKHPNIAAFIKHGGLNSIQESIYWVC